MCALGQERACLPAKVLPPGTPYRAMGIIKGVWRRGTPRQPCELGQPWGPLKRQMATQQTQTLPTASCLCSDGQDTVQPRKAVLRPQGSPPWALGCWNRGTVPPLCPSMRNCTRGPLGREEPLLLLPWHVPGPAKCGWCLFLLPPPCQPPLPPPLGLPRSPPGDAQNHPEAQCAEWERGQVMGPMVLAPWKVAGRTGDGDSGKPLSSKSELQS